jgi:hypothetical protein
LVGVGIVGETAAEVDGRKCGGVPGVGGLHGAGLGRRNFATVPG